MGITIHYQLTTTKPLISSLFDRAEKKALEFQEIAKKVDVSFEIVREPDYLLINIGGCESLYFEFQTPKKIKEKYNKHGWSYEYSTLLDEKKELEEGYMIDKYPENERVYAASFCKTQFCDNIIEHVWVAEILRVIASYCIEAKIEDEGDYYHTGEIKKAEDSILQVGDLINSMINKFDRLGYEKENIQAGQTKIKPFSQN